MTWLRMKVRLIALLTLRQLKGNVLPSILIEVYLPFIHLPVPQDALKKKYVT